MKTRQRKTRQRRHDNGDTTTETRQRRHDNGDTTTETRQRRHDNGDTTTETRQRRPTTETRQRRTDNGDNYKKDEANMLEKYVQHNILTKVYSKNVKKNSTSGVQSVSPH